MPGEVKVRICFLGFPLSVAGFVLFFFIYIVGAFPDISLYLWTPPCTCWQRAQLLQNFTPSPVLWCKLLQPVSTDIENTLSKKLPELYVWFSDRMHHARTRTTLESVVHNPFGLHNAAALRGDQLVKEDTTPQRLLCRHRIIICFLLCCCLLTELSCKSRIAGGGAK